MNVATLAYVPSHHRLNPEAFLRNLNHWKNSHEVILYSDNPHDSSVLEIPSPDAIKASSNRVAINNLLFLQAVKICEQRGIERFIYLESDCRVCRDGWDGDMFNEASRYPDMFAAGTPAQYNRKKMPDSQKSAIDAAVSGYTRDTGFSVPSFDSRAERPLGCWFIMGGGAVYSTAIASDIFLYYEKDLASKAVQDPAFDLKFGLRCYQLFREKAVNKLPWLKCVFSTYGNKINTEKERIEMAKSGRWATIHQIKSNNDCIQ